MTYFDVFVCDTYYVLNPMEDVSPMPHFHGRLPKNAGQDARKDAQKTARGYTEGVVQKRKQQKVVQ